MKTRLIFGALMAASLMANAQWLPSGSNVYYNPLSARVGIGTSAPVLKLDIETSSTNDGIRVKQTGTTIASLNLESVTGRRWALFSTGSGNSEGAGNFGLFDYSGGGYRMFVNGSTGNTGFGTITPQQMLTVNNGALLLSGSVPGFGGPQLLFSDNASVTPNGRWAIEYNAIGGLNFWTPWNPSGPVGSAGNYSLFLRDDGKIGMGVTDDPGDGNFCASAFNGNYRLYVNGGILTTKVKVANYCSASWADYVFAPDYELPTLADVETYIKENNHLPNIPSATAIEKEGLDLADMQSKQMAKIEELTLYLIDMKKEIDELKKQNAALQAISSSSKN